jgi:formyltetrahydrofolate deformylase
MTTSFILTLSCPDKAGIVHAVSGLLLQHGANIEEAAQFNDDGTQLFFMRVRFACDVIRYEQIRTDLEALAHTWSMQFELHHADRRIPTVIMVSQHGHCINDLLFRWRSGLLPVEIRGIISNHREFYQLAASYNIPFHHIPVTAATKPEAEARQLEIVRAAVSYTHLRAHETM